MSTNEKKRTITGRLAGAADSVLATVGRYTPVPINMVTMARDVVNKNLGNGEYTPNELTEADFSKAQLKAILGMRLESGGRGITKDGIGSYLKTANGDSSGYGASSTSMFTRLTNPASQVETTIGQASESKEDGRSYLTDTYDFNEKSRDYYRRKAAEPDSGMYVKIRNFAQQHGSTDKDPDDGKIKVKINLDNARKIVLGDAANQDAKGGETRQDAKGGNASGEGGDSSSHVKRNGNLSPLGRKRYLFRDKNGKVEAYGTQDSIVMLDSDRGEYVAIPTIVDGRAPMSDTDAFAHYKKTGEFFHRSKNVAEVRRAAHEAHLESADEGRSWWNNYIADHINDDTLGPELAKMREDPGFMKWARGEDPDSEMKRVRQDAKGGETRADSVGGADVPQGGPAVPAGGPRIVINPSTFRNKKDALCVAFNEGLRVLMEEMGFEPQAEPTEAQRRFFADTAYAKDELQLRRTILARICTLDTSIS